MNVNMDDDMIHLYATMEPVAASQASLNAIPFLHGTRYFLIMRQSLLYA